VCVCVCVFVCGLGPVLLAALLSVCSCLTDTRADSLSELKKQILYYFGTRNLSTVSDTGWFLRKLPPTDSQTSAISRSLTVSSPPQDFYLNGLMDANNFVPISSVAGFRRMRVRCL
jgi:hypothetical protein